MSGDEMLFAKITKNGQVIDVDAVPIWISPEEEQAGMVILEVKGHVKVGDYMTIAAIVERMEDLHAKTSAYCIELEAELAETRAVLAKIASQNTVEEHEAAYGNEATGDYEAAYNTIIELAREAMVSEASKGTRRRLT